MTESRLTSYALTAGGVTALAAGGAANADIITSTGPIQINLNQAHTDLFTIDGVEVKASNFTYGSYYSGGAFAYIGVMAAGGDIGTVAYGSSIGPDFVGRGSNNMNSRGWTTNTSWGNSHMPLGTSLLLGIVVPGDGLDYYAWVNYSLGWYGGNEFTFTINSWAYNDVAGEGIIAGQNLAAGSNPVPGLGGLAALAIGAAGVRSRRQRNVA